MTPRPVLYGTRRLADLPHAAPDWDAVYLQRPTLQPLRHPQPCRYWLEAPWSPSLPTRLPSLLQTLSRSLSPPDAVVIALPVGLPYPMRLPTGLPPDTPLVFLRPHAQTPHLLLSRLPPVPYHLALETPAQADPGFLVALSRLQPHLLLLTPVSQSTGLPTGFLSADPTPSPDFFREALSLRPQQTPVVLLRANALQAHRDRLLLQQWDDARLRTTPFPQTVC
jgi:hypothetical protein